MVWAQETDCRTGLRSDEARPPVETILVTRAGKDRRRVVAVVYHAQSAKDMGREQLTRERISLVATKSAPLWSRNPATSLAT